MKLDITIFKASTANVSDILDLIQVNIDEGSLFKRSPEMIENEISEFYIAKNRSGTILGCVQIQWYKNFVAELQVLSVLPKYKNQGVGTALVNYVINTVIPKKPQHLWLATDIPQYFKKYGFKTFSFFELPILLILKKTPLLLSQPISRWLPALFSKDRYLTYQINRH